MGAMALPLHWIPEDDVLLRSAIEAGASLESLAKGAVQFSRRYTVQELQDRWLSLLYDPDVYVEASEHMTEVERWGVTNQLRPNKLGVKNMACSSGKRKRESIRKSYYAMRKRIRSEPFDAMGINLVSGPGYSNFIDNNELLSADCGIVNHVPSNLGAQGPDYGVKHHTSNEFGSHDAKSTENGVTPTFIGVQNHRLAEIGGENVSDNLPYRYDESTSQAGDCSMIPEFVHSKDLPLCNLFEDEDLVNQRSSYSEFDGQSFCNFDCPSLPQIPDWRSSQEIAEAGLPIQIGDGDMQVRDEFMIPPAADVSDTLGYGGAPLNPKLETPLPCDSMIDMNSTTQEYLEELFDLSSDEGLLYMDTDRKEAIEKSYLEGLSSLLLEFPNQCESNSSVVAEVAVAVDGLLVDRTDAPNSKDLCGNREVADTRVTVSGSTMKVGPEYRNGVICCTLNTEDPEIPSNDDVFLPFRFPSPTKSSGAHWGLRDTSYLSSPPVKNFSSTCHANGGSLVMKNNQKGSSVSSGKMEPFHPTNTGLRYRNQGPKFELPESRVQHAAIREAQSIDCGSHVNLANITANTFISGSVKESPMEMGQENNIRYTTLGHCPDRHESSLSTHQNLQKKSICGQSGLDGIAEISNNGSSNADLSFQQTDVPGTIDQSLLSDQEEIWSENEFDVPYFSDVEAMILDMDLSPDEFDFHTNPEVQRYQHEETKRAIIRLEQGADAFTQRALAHHSAFAHLYGRYTKYYIKKPEVLLGRSSDEIAVDIDLGREKNGGKISRKQATIKLDMHGVFQLKNLGKVPIYINGKEVATGQSTCLVSGCLIEIRSLAFLFETNHKMIKQYVDSHADGGLLADDKPSD